MGNLGPYTLSNLRWAVSCLGIGSQLYRVGEIPLSRWQKSLYTAKHAILSFPDYLPEMAIRMGTMPYGPNCDLSFIYVVKHVLRSDDFEDGYGMSGPKLICTWAIQDWIDAVDNRFWRAGSPPPDPPNPRKLQRIAEPPSQREISAYLRYLAELRQTVGAASKCIAAPSPKIV